MLLSSKCILILESKNLLRFRKKVANFSVREVANACCRLSVLIETTETSEEEVEGSTYMYNLSLTRARPTQCL